MAKNKLEAFTRFANTLLPHETTYLLSVQRLVDDQKRSILERVHLNCTNIKQFTPYDVDLDKRKYSHLKNWIQKKLHAVDADEDLKRMLEWERKISTDAIEAEEEKQLLKRIRNYKGPIFFFNKLYEIAQNYRHFLLIRLRYKDYELVNQFLCTYEADYLESKRINEQLHQASMDITQQYSANDTESIQWEKWLRSVLFNEHLDGHNRYMAFVRLSFIAFNYRKFDLLWDAMDYLDDLFSKGVFYSKRILLNYYHLRMMLYARVRDFDKAVHFGFLSVRGHTHDYLFYINNLSAVLLRAGRVQEALQVMRDANKEMKQTQNFYNKIGFVAFYVQCLIKNQMLPNAISYCRSFLNAYEKEILQYRWHTFFRAYLEALLLRKQFLNIEQLNDRYKLLKREEAYQNRADYVPTIDWYILIAKYKLGKYKQEQVRNHLQTYLNNCKEMGNNPRLDELLQTLKKLVPEVVNYLHLGFKYSV